MIIDQFKYKQLGSDMDMNRLMELAGIDGARDVQLQSPDNDRGAISHREPKSWEDGQDEFHPDVQDINDENRTQGIQAMEEVLNSLDKLCGYIATQESETNPEFNTIKDQVEALKLSIQSKLGDESHPPVQAPNNPGGGTQRDPTNQW